MKNPGTGSPQTGPSENPSEQPRGSELVLEVEELEERLAPGGMVGVLSGS